MRTRKPWWGMFSKGMLAVGVTVTAGGCILANAQTFAYVPNGVTVSVIDTGTNTVVDSVPGLSSPFGAAVTPNGAFAYVTNFQGTTVSVIDRANTVVATVPGLDQPFTIAVTPNGAFAYAGNLGNDSVSVISTASNVVVATIPLPPGSQPVGVAIAPNGSFVYVSDQGTNAVSVISTATNSVVATVPVGDNPAFLAITPNSSFVYVPNFHSTTVSVISTATNSVIATVPVGTHPVGVGVRPDGAIAYVSNKDDNTVSAISTATNTVLSVIPVGNGPSEIAFTADGSFAYIVNLNSGTASVLETASNTIVATIPVGSGAQTIAITPADNDSRFAQLSGSNTFIGNQAINGSVTANSFVGDGSGLTGVIAASANIANLANYATSAGDAATLGGIPASAFAPASGSPSYVAKAGDSMTGTLNLAPNGLVVGGNQLLLVGGNIGIGTASPEALPGYTSLHIDNAGTGFGGSFLELTHSPTGMKGRVVMDDHGFLLNAVNSAPVKIKAGSTFNGGSDPGHIYISPSGNVGIWTGSPAAALDVNGTANFSGLVTFASGQTFPGVGNGTITGVTAGIGLSGGGTSGNVSLTNAGVLSVSGGNGIASSGGQNPSLSLNTNFTDSRYLLLSGGTLTGSLSAPGFSGGGAGLTNLNPANLSSGTAAINVTGNAASATNALNLAGKPPTFYATLGANSFSGSQNISGDVNVTGTVSAPNVNVNGPFVSGLTGGLSTAGMLITSTGAANSAQGFPSNPLQLWASAFSSNAFPNPRWNQVFQWVVEPVGNNTPNPSATLNLQFFSADQPPPPSGYVAQETGLSFGPHGELAIGNGTMIRGHMSVVFQNVAFNAKMTPGTCTVWSGPVSNLFDGDSVAVTMGSSLMTANIVYSAWASNGAVQVRICNPTGAPTTVGSGNIRVDVWKH